MGSDKGLLDWYGMPQRYYQADLLARYCDQVFISCRNDQVQEIEDAGYRPLEDDSNVVGQYGAILTAMKAHPDTAFLVLACDIPLADHDTIAELVNQRDSFRLSTAYMSEDGLPEPLIAIWEPQAVQMLLERAEEGISCPRKALILSGLEVKLISPSNPDTIMNVNTPEAAEQARELIEARSHVS